MSSRGRTGLSLVEGSYGARQINPTRVHRPEQRRVGFFRAIACFFRFSTRQMWRMLPYSLRRRVPGHRRSSSHRQDTERRLWTRPRKPRRISFQLTDRARPRIKCYRGDELCEKTPRIENLPRYTLWRRSLERTDERTGFDLFSSLYSREIIPYAAGLFSLRKERRFVHNIVSLTVTCPVDSAK